MIEKVEFDCILMHKKHVQVYFNKIQNSPQKEKKYYIGMKEQEMCVTCGWNDYLVLQSSSAIRLQM